MSGNSSFFPVEIRTDTRNNTPEMDFNTFEV